MFSLRALMLFIFTAFVLVSFSLAIPTERFLADHEEVNSTILVLAANRTHRRDPSNCFKMYRGGWNVINNHYWASVAFTAAPFFIVAALWFVGFGLCSTAIGLCYCCCRREPYGYSRIAYVLSLILLICFTAAAIAGCVILYIGQGRFVSSTMNSMKYVVHQAHTTSDNLTNVAGYLDAAKQIKVDQVSLASNVLSDIDQLQTRINSSSSSLSTNIQEDSDTMEKLIRPVRLSLIILSANVLFLTFLGFVFSVFGVQFAVYILVIAGWVLATETFILCGVFLILHNVTGDTCASMNQWVQHPTAGTALDDILPCVDKATAQETLTKSKEVTFQLVDLMNTVISNVSNSNFAPNLGPHYHNPSGPLVPRLCNPFHPDLTDRVCTPGEVNMNNATHVWDGYVCKTLPNGTCGTSGRLIPSMYLEMTAGLNVSYNLYRYVPFLVEVRDCTFMRQTFSDIHAVYCPGLRRYSRFIYVGLVMLATAVMVSLVFWVLYGRERRHRINRGRGPGM